MPVFAASPAPCRLIGASIFKRALHPPFQRMIGGTRTRAPTPLRRISVPQLSASPSSRTAIGKYSGLGDFANGFGRLENVGKRNSSAPARNVGRILQAHPRFGDDAEPSFRADEQTIGLGPAPEPGNRGDSTISGSASRRAADWTKSVDVRVERREVTARSVVRDPSAERRGQNDCGKCRIVSPCGLSCA